ncbi:hypothetical protein DFH09DRAFT_1285147 [Mycena vulgaris]|nr:hypothetical protein DFH09DRAFT_1285147 [Mycena vulgaris]
MPSLSLPAAELLATFLSSLLYGIYLVTLGITGWILLITRETGTRRWKRCGEMNWIVVCVCVLLFINVTVDLGMAVTFNVQAFVSYKGLGGPEHVFTHASGWQTFTKTFCVFLQSLTGDAILIYRCWFLWHKSWVVIGLPILVWLANLACSIGLLVTLTKISDGLAISYQLQPWGRSLWVSTICTNIVVTALIVWRIWRVERENKRLRCSLDPADDQPQSQIGRAMWTIIESGMIYTATTILMFAAYMTQSTLAYPASSLEIHSVGIMFNFIIIRGARQSLAESESMNITPILFSPAIITSSGNSRSIVGGEEKADLFVPSRLEQGSDCASATV